MITQMNQVGHKVISCRLCEARLTYAGHPLAASPMHIEQFPSRSSGCSSMNLQDHVTIVQRGFLVMRPSWGGTWLLRTKIDSTGQMREYIWVGTSHVIRVYESSTSIQKMRVHIIPVTCDLWSINQVYMIYHFDFVYHVNHRTKRNESTHW